MKLLTAGLILLKIVAISLMVNTYYGAVISCTSDTTCTASSGGVGADSKCCYYLRPTGSPTRICSDSNTDRTLVGQSAELDNMRKNGTLVWTCNDPALETGHALGKISACLFTLMCLNLFAYL